MKNTSKILVPTDFSASSENALRFAIKMAEEMDKEIILLHVVYPETVTYEVPLNISLALQNQTKYAKEKMATITEKVLTQLVQQIKKVPIIETKIKLGIPETEICTLAKQKDIEFIFMGTKREHGNLDKLLGSVASTVMKNADCPVMVIPEQAVYQDTTIVAYATDLIEADPYEIWRLAKLLSPFHPILRCVHFYENEEQENTPIKMEELTGFFSENAPALQITFHNIQTKNKEESLIEFLETYSINILAMYRTQRGFFEKLRHRSFTKKMVLKSSVPIFVLK